MQNIKGAIRLFAILMGLCCVYYLSFTWATNNHEDKADKYATNVIGTKAVQDTIAARVKRANGTETLKKEMLDSAKDENMRFFLEDSMPSKSIWLGNTYMDCKEKEINLGLDLKGGMNVTLEVSVAEIIKALSGNNTSPEFASVMASATEKSKNSTTDFVTLFATAFREKLPNGNMSTFFRSQLKDKIAFNATNDDVVKVLRAEASESVDRAKLVLEKRINKFGVAQPNIQKLESSGRILVELPGVKDTKRVRKLLQGTANLEFWRTYENAEALGALANANYKLQVMLGIVDSLPKDSSLVAMADSMKGKADSARVYDSLAAVIAKDTTKNKAAKADSTQKKSPLFDIMQPMYDQKSNQAYPGPIVGTSLQKDTAKVMALLRKTEIRALFPSDMRFAWSVKPVKANNGGDLYQLVALRAEANGRSALSGEVIVDARKEYSNKGGASPEITMVMNTEGTQAWSRITGENIGKSVAIVLDGNVYTYPTVQSKIEGGNSQITGSFTSREADDIVNVLKAGRLPAPARIVEEVVVGPTLGQEAISAGVISFLVALVVVLIYMAFYYNKAGLVADIALFVNVFFIMGILSSLGAVLTLPGIAGIVLTIALSVDANILIFERIREELREGKGTAIAIADGYKHAMSSILDSNLTTLILGIILYSFGSGPVQGFATTLIIGILSSMFCAIFITRLVFDGMLKRNKEIKFSTPATENLLRNTKIDFVGRRRLYYIISASIITLGIVFYFQKGGFNLGVDFSGGRSYTVSFVSETSPEKVRSTLEQNDFFPGASLEVKTAGSSNRLKITTNYEIENNSETIDDEVAAKLEAGLIKIAGDKGKFKVESSVKVGPSIANDVINSSYLVIGFSCLLMFMYILFRFRRWQFGLGAVAALLHDVLIVLSCYVIFDGLLPFPLEIDQHFIAAILTVMGYSMTDTVVVFDRIREFLGAKKGEVVGAEKRNLINYALNSTLSRTINTSMITFFVLLAIFIFGGETIKGFSFALLIGIVIGTYSSLCIATPVVIDFDRKEKLKA